MVLTLPTPGADNNTWGDELNAYLTASNSGVYNVLHYGADPTGVALSTDALQATIDAAVTSEVATGVITLPAGTFDIDDVLAVSYRSGTVIQGQGPGVTTIRQRTDNTAIFRFVTDPFAHHITVRDLTLTWTNQQENTDTGAIAIDLWGDANAQPNFITLENLIIDKAHYGVKASNSTDHTIPFVTMIRDVSFGNQAGPAVSVMSAGGKPNWIIERVYIAPGTGSAKPPLYALEFNGCDLTTRGLTIDSWPHHILYSVGSTLPIIFDGLHIEGGTLDDPGGTMRLFYIGGSGFLARGVNYQATLNAAGEYYWLFYGDGNAGAVCSIDGLVSSATITNGNLYPLGLENGAIGRVSGILGTWTQNPGLMAFGTTTNGIYEVDGRQFGGGVYDVKARGAVGDGVTDDTAAIQAALDAAYAAGGGLVTVPQGTFIITAQLEVPHGVVMRGAGRHATIIRAKTAVFPEDTALVRLGSSDQDLAFGCRVENLNIDCYAIAGSIGVITDQVQEQSGLRNVLVNSYMARGLDARDGTGAKFAQHFHVIDCEFYTHPDSVNPEGLYFETMQSCLLERVTVFDTNATIGTRAGFEFNDSEFTAIDLHAEYFNDGLLLYNSSAGMVYGMGGSNLNQMINIGSNTMWFSCANVGMAASTIGAYLQDQVNGQYITVPVAFHATGVSWMNGVRWRGFSTTASTPTTTELTETKTLGIHRNSGDSKVYLAYNDGGVIKKVELT